MIAENEITPQSNYVGILHSGLCFWEPRFELSITQCRVDVTWFPFDVQTCDLVFESWMLKESILKLNTDNLSAYEGNYMEPNGWYLLSMFRHREIFYILSLIHI